MIYEQLTHIAYTKEIWHKNLLPVEELNAYHERLLVQGNIITYVIEGNLIGYVEFWRINTEQLGRIIIGQPILTDVEDIINGPIAYINNMYIDPDYRNGEAFEMLATMFLVKNKDAEVFVACRNLKHHKPVQVYSRNDLIRLYTKGV
jgi:hypothetical protein